MTDIIELRKLKSLAKHHARSNRIALHEALDLVAGQLGFSHWSKMTVAAKKGWLPTSEDLTKVEAFVGDTHPTLEFRRTNTAALELRFDNMARAEDGKIGAHPYRLLDVLGDVIIAGEGWSICIPEAPNAAPIVETAGGRVNTSAVHDPKFLREALRIAKDRSQLVRARISTDWPRRSTKPDSEGKVRHPLYGCESNEWYCLHCDGMISGNQLAENLWHCPGCRASPLDIFETPFWLSENADKPSPVEAEHVDESAQQEVKIVEATFKLEMDDRKIALLMRSALIEDASNTSERLGALLAEIIVDEENDVWIVLDQDLWPEDKEPVQAFAVAELLDVEVDLAITCMTAPFAWSGLGEMTSSTREYMQMLLDAYAQYGASKSTK
jgi:hypothetical protein